jgi:hypothetical protein
VQLRDGTNGDRWRFDIGTVLENNGADWTAAINVPFSRFYGESSNPSGASFSLAAIDQVRFLVNSAGVAIKLRLDRLEVVRQ